MAVYTVRCCCQPTKVLGYLELRAGLKHGDRVPIYRPAMVTTLEPWPPCEIEPPEFIELREFGRLIGPSKWTYELAVYSDDRPIEFWQTVPGFKPA